jgi:translocation and assembly module TamB
MTLAPTRFVVGNGTVDARAILTRKTDDIDAHLSLSAISIGDANDVFSVGHTIVDGKIDIAGQMTNAGLAGSLAARFQPNDGAKPITITLTAEVRDGRATFTGSAAGLSSEDARLKADLPMTLDLSGPRLHMDMQTPANAHLAWRGEIKPLWDMLADEQHTVAGETDIDIRMAGTLAAPAVTGGIHLTKGLYENLAAGTALHNVALDVTAHSSDAINLTLSATDTGAGTLKAQGNARKGDGPYAWALEASGELKQFHILRRDDVTAAADGRITYQGTLREGTLGGDLKIVRSELRLGESYQPEIPLLRGIAAQGQSSGVSGIKLAIALSVPDVLRTEGKGLEAFWRGDIKVTGDINNPDLVGQLSLARGTFSFLGRTFDLSSGTVTFTGGGTIDPDLNVVAVRQAEDITATVTISGRASQPRITLSSQPALPQDEVLARLLFRKGATQLGPLETLQLANAAADLTGLSRGGLTGVLRRASGLDILDFGGASGNAIVIGTQLSNALYVGIEQNVNDSSRRIVIEWRLTRQFSLQSTTTDKTGSDLGILWRKNY